MKTYDLVPTGVKPLQAMSDDGVVVCKFTVPLVADVYVGVGNNSYAPEMAAGIVACISKTAGQMQDWAGRANLQRQINPGLSANWHRGNSTMILQTGETWYLNITGAKASGILVTLRYS